ncbi:MAG TPA: hypothetical protein P5117_07295 [Spirochaetia bacterium]|nr:hypothetical protein [Spirochaetales bacterium]HRY79485.1 hypothetical protein [Spirochaetia bacterium]HRZ89273.1 hypothetical protein [Spirochaetia bacterium]
MMTRLTEAQCRSALSRGEFEADVLGSAASVAVVLTQSWCPQWVWMRSYLEGLPDSPEYRVYYLEYDREPFYEEFLAFKEDTLGNREIPYVRYYRDGRLNAQTNFIAKDGFLKRLAGF